MPVNSVGKKKFLILAVAILLVATTAIYSSGAEVVNTPRTAWVSHTEYEAGDVASTIVRITDGETGEMIRQIPSEEMLEIARSLDKMQGLLLRQEA